ncbi:MAG: glycosyltransferase [Alphaproteobacteria bacterium]|nr:glycosyltransferase [Alphaproteobacteria bacterium]MDE2630575.1 glycosyltransferase [Alphaproteobacteria bacterium]
MTVLTLLSLVVWLVLLLGRGFFWLARERDDRDRPPAPDDWHSVVAVVPARNEADVIVRSVGSLLAQDYSGSFRVILVDDQSSDGTGDAARAVADDRLTVLDGAAHPAGWTGKLFAVSQGVAHADAADPPDYLWLTDADIAHTPDNLRHLVARAEKDRLVLVSLMAKLNCESFAERFLIPAFVFFFAMLFPFAWANDPRKRLAAAAGGCMLVKREALARAGGIEAIRNEIIDDCALGRRLKAQGPIWLGLTERSVSLRPYARVADIRAMVARSAYAQLGYSPLVLAGAVLGMAFLYVVPLTGFADGGIGALAGACTWAAMTVAFQPMLHFYRRSPFWGLALPVIGVFYAAFTIDSAVQYWRGRGGMWKGRAQAIA